MASASAPVPYALAHEEEDDYDDEVDQLASSDDEQRMVVDEPPPTPASPPEEISAMPPRRPGHSHLPSEKLEQILLADGTTGSLPLTKEGLFLISIATEEFIKRFTQGGKRHATSDRRNIITYTDTSSTVQQYQEFRFLKDIIPSPMSLQEALSLREQKLNSDILEDDTPLTLPRSAMPPPVSHTTPQHPGTYNYQIPPQALAAATLAGNGDPGPSSSSVKDQTAVSMGPSGQKLGRMTNGKSKANAADANVLALGQSSASAHQPNDTTTPSVPATLPAPSSQTPNQPLFSSPEFAHLLPDEREILEVIAKDLRAAALQQQQQQPATSASPETSQPIPVENGHVEDQASKESEPAIDSNVQ